MALLPGKSTSCTVRLGCLNLKTAIGTWGQRPGLIKAQPNGLGNRTIKIQALKGRFIPGCAKIIPGK